MTLQQAQARYDEARHEALTMKARGVDQQTMATALLRVSEAKRQLDAAQGDANMSAEITRLTAGMTGTGNGGGRRNSLGNQYVASDGYKWIQQRRGAFPQGPWSSPIVELPLWGATLTEDPASGGDVVIPQVVPGITQLPLTQPTVASLMGPGATLTNLIRFVKETTYTNAADAVAEAAAKPESTLIYDAVDVKIEKVAHFIPVTYEMLEDVAQMRSIIDARLRMGVDIKVDDLLLNGTGVSPQVQGFLTLPGLAAAVPRGADSNSDAIRKQIAAIEAANPGIPVDAVVMNPTNYLTIELMKNAAGDYQSGAGPLGSSAPRRLLWDKLLVTTAAIAAGTALVGAFREGAFLFRHGGVRVEASNSHSDFFIKNLVAILAETRIAPVHLRPGAFGLVTGLN